MNEFAQQLKGHLKRKKMSQGALARAADLSTTHVSNIMNGRRLPTKGSLADLAGALGLSATQKARLAAALGRVRYPN